MVIESLPGRSKPQCQDETGAPDVPVGCYIVGCALALFMAVFAVEYWDAELRWYGVLLACAVALVFYPPVCHLHQNCLRLVFRCSPFSFSILAGNCLRNIEFQDKH